LLYPAELQAQSVLAPKRESLIPPLPLFVKVQISAWLFFI